MSEFEKAELLRDRTNVSFEEARYALRACNGSLVDALEYIERRKRAERFDNARVNQGYDRTEAAAEYCEQSRSFGGWLWNVIKAAFRKSVETDLVAKKDGIEKLHMPVLLFIILLMVFNVLTMIVLVVSLLNGVTYSFRSSGIMYARKPAPGKTYAKRQPATAGAPAPAAESAPWYENSRRISCEVKDLCRKYDNIDKNR